MKWLYDMSETIIIAAISAVTVVSALGTAFE